MADENSNRAANLAVIFGIPVALGLCTWGLSEIVDSGRKIERMLAVLESIQRDMRDQNRRLDRLENGYFGKH